MTNKPLLLHVVVLCLVFCTNSQQFTSVFTVDDFSVSSEGIVDYPSFSNDPVFTNSTSPSILGSVRLIEAKVVVGKSGTFASIGAEVVSGFFYAYAAVGPISGYAALIYDGSASSQINPSGLFGSSNTNFTVSNGNALHIKIGSTIYSGNANLTATIYSGSMGDTCQSRITVIGNGNEIDYFLPFDSFTKQGNGCDFSNVGAVTFRVDVSTSQSALIDEIEVVYLPPPTTVFVIDGFKPNTGTALITVPAGGVPAGGMEAFKAGYGYPLEGGERDMQLYVYQALGEDLYIFSQVFDGVFTYSSNGIANGIAILQYDGSDASPTLQPNGLGALNFTSNYGYAFQFGVLSSTQTLISLYVYSGTVSDYCVTTILTPENRYHEYTIAFSGFYKAGAGCDFSSVGAVELVLSIDNAMTATVYFFNVIN